MQVCAKGTREKLLECIKVTKKCAGGGGELHDFKNYKSKENLKLSNKI